MLKINNYNNYLIIGNRKKISKYPFNLTIKDFSKYDNNRPGFKESDTQYLYIYKTSYKLNINSTVLTFDLSNGFEVSVSLTTTLEHGSYYINDIMFIGPLNSKNDNAMPICLSSSRTGSKLGYPTFSQNYDSVYMVYAVDQMHTFSSIYDSSNPDYIITSFDNKNPETYLFSRRSGYLTTPYTIEQSTESMITLGNWKAVAYTCGSNIYSFTFNGFCNQMEGDFIIK